MKVTISTYTNQVHVIEGVDHVNIDKHDYYISFELLDEHGRMLFGVPLSNLSTVRYEYD